MKDSIRTLIVEYMQEQKLMQLATVGENGPWICSVWQAIDEHMNIYFLSATNRQHSLDIALNPHVAGALAKPHEVGDPARAIQFRGTANLLTGVDEIALARSVYEGRTFDAAQIETFMSDAERPHAFYKITPTKFVLFDTENFPENSRQEYIPE